MREGTCIEPAERPGAGTKSQVRLMGIDLDAVTPKECVDIVVDGWRTGEAGWLHTLNLDHLRMIHAGTFFEGPLPEAKLRVCDGTPLVWASRLQGTPLPGRVPGSDLIRTLTEAAARHGRRVFFFGGNPNAAKEASAILAKDYPGFVNAGILCPDFGFEKDHEALREIERQLVEAQPDLLFMAIGAPKSERLLQQWLPLLPKTWIVPIGISFSFVTGEVVRAPRWVQAIGLEWFHRLAQEPSRLWRRYLLHGLPFAVKLMFASGAARFRGTRQAGPGGNAF